MNSFRQKSRKIWTDAETNIFIDIWGEFYQKLRNAKRNSHIMVEMAQHLEARNISVNATEVLNKKNNLSKRYRSERRAMSLSGSLSSEWPLYERVHEIFNSFKVKRNGNSNLSDVSEDSIECKLENSTFLETSEISNDTLFSDFSDMSAVSSSTSTVLSYPSVPPVASTPRAKKRKIDAHDEIKDIMDRCSQIVAHEMKRSNDLLAEANEIENKKLKIVDNFVNSNISFQNSIIALFQKEKQ